MADWKEGMDGEERINRMLHNIEQHRNAFRQSKYIEDSQAWTYLLEHKKRSDNIRKRMDFVETLAKRGWKEEAPIIVERRPEGSNFSLWQLPIGAISFTISLLILSNITIAESASLSAFTTSLLISHLLITFAGVMWASAVRD